MKVYSLDEMLDRHIGKVGTERRDAFERKFKEGLELDNNFACDWKENEYKEKCKVECDWCKYWDNYLEQDN